MRVAASLEIPRDVEMARVRNELVIFAGAGVSMGEPARLPGFVELAKQIAEPRVPWSKEWEERIDRYLGRASDAGVDVHALARDLLTNERSHNSLHESLLGVFAEPQNVRLVTTNFDSHFSAAARTVFEGVTIPHYVGPALPPGRMFRGIAQLHGALSRSEDGLVLTDRDFAEAYMSEGWAARFLVPLLEGRTVLFVGYRLGDPLMQYLLRAVRPTAGWFAVIPEADVARAEDLAVTPITYRNDGDHTDLVEGMRRWRWYAAAPASDHAHELERLVSGGPPVSPVDSDYVRARIETDDGRQVFVSCAKGDAWFEWLVRERVLNVLLDERSSREAASEWGKWALRNYCSGNNPPLLRFLRGRSLLLNPQFASELEYFLWACKEWPARDVVRQLIALVVSQPSMAVQARHVGPWLFERLVEEGMDAEAIMILGHLTRLHLEPIERLEIAHEEEVVDAEAELQALANRVGMRVDPAYLVRSVHKQGAVLASREWERLVELVERRVSEAYALVEVARGSGNGFDWLSFGRAAVAPSNQDSHPRAEDVLVELGRTTLDAAPNASVVQEFAYRHDRGQGGLLQRLALYAHSLRPREGADDVLLRAVALRWDREVLLRPELYRVLQAHAANACEESLRALVAALREPELPSDESRRHGERVRFDLSCHLARVAPASVVVAQFAKEEAESHPEWQEHDVEGLFSRVEVRWGGDGPSPIDAAAFMGMTAEDALRTMEATLSEAGTRDLGPALMGAAQEAMRTDAAWGVRLILFAVEGRTPFGLSVAESLLWGTRSCVISDSDRLSLLALLERVKVSEGLARAMGSVLAGWCEDIEPTASEELLAAYERAGDVLFEAAAGLTPGLQGFGWTEGALNHPAGCAALTWWRVANARDRVEGQMALSVDEAEKARWLRVLSDTTAAGDYARPILGMAIERLGMADFPWTAEQVLPAFSVTGGERQAAQLWDGRLMQRRWSPAAWEWLRPHFGGLLGRSGDLLPHRAKELGDLVAFVACDAEHGRLTVADLQTFVLYASEEARVEFARQLPRHSARCDAEVRERVWRELLQPYWRQRRLGQPVAFTADELREMLAWVSESGIPPLEALDELNLSPNLSLAHADAVIFGWTQEGEWLKANPTAAVGLIAFLAKRKLLPGWSGDIAVALLSAALQSGCPAELVVAAAEHLVGLSAAARPLIERLRRR